MRSCSLLGGFVGILSICLLAGCGDNDTSVPTVIDTDPAEGATGVSTYPIVRVWFSEAMDPATIDTLSFYIDGLRAHSVVYDGIEYKATLYPATLAEASTEYRVHVGAGVEDAEGTAMGQEASFAFTTGGIDGAGLADRFEPNDDVDSATPLDLDVIYPGLTSSGAGERIDIYSFTLAEPLKVDVLTQAAYVDTERVSWQINFRRTDGKYYATLGTSITASLNTPSYHYSFLPGTYLVEIGNYYASSHLVIYHLFLETSAPAADDQYEDNDFPDEAKPISVDLHEGLRGAHVDADYYSIELAEGQTLTATATMVGPPEVNRRIEICSQSGSVYTSQQEHVNPIEVSWTAAEAGTYLIMVMWWTDDIVYSLNVEVTP